MTQLWIRRDDSTSTERVTESHPLPVEIPQNLRLPPLTGNTVMSMTKVPGVTIASAYSDGDAFGTGIVFTDVFRPEKRSGVVVALLLYDLDDEGLATDVAFFSRRITAPTDHSAFAPSDTDLLAFRGAVAIATANYFNWGSNQVAVVKDIGLWVQSEDNNLYCQLITRGAPNIAAGAEPWIAVVVIPD